MGEVRETRGTAIVAPNGVTFHISASGAPRCSVSSASFFLRKRFFLVGILQENILNNTVSTSVVAVSIPGCSAVCSGLDIAIQL